MDFCELHLNCHLSVCDRLHFHLFFHYTILIRCYHILLNTSHKLCHVVLIIVVDCLQETTEKVFLLQWASLGNFNVNPFSQFCVALGF